MVTSDLAKSTYADRSSQLMGAAQKLRDLGAQAFLDVPRIAVIGGQSAGKSSLVEAVSGIRVPRDAGTCTRCPMEVNLINSPGAWSCYITLRIEYAISGARLPQVLRIPFGPCLSNVDDVELALRRAQTAVLNHPKMDSDTFLLKSREDLEYYRTPNAFKAGTLKFSRNVVVVDIFDASCANLSFVDLPGLIQNDEPEVVQLVEDLVSSYIQGHCLILVTIPMSDDMENQRAMRLALEADQNKSRTIGVLTKPDTLTSGATSARNKWKDMLDGSNKSDNHTLAKGYYCVRLSDDAERAENPSREERNAIESTFFSTTSPWDTVRDRSRFGITHLVNDLSRLLTGLLDDMLPTLRKQSQEQLDEARAALQKLPTALNDVSSEVLERITNFCQEFSATVYGTTVMSSELQIRGHLDCCGKSFIHRNRTSYKEFKHEIRSTAPDFRPFEGYGEYDKPIFSDPERYNSIEGLGNGPRDLLYVRKVIQDSIAWELPNNVPFDAKHALIDELTRQWDEPTSECFEEVYENLTTVIGHILHRHFGRFRKLNNHMEDLLKDLLDEHKESANSSVLALLKQEKHPLYTQNEHYFLTLRLHWLERYTNVRANQDIYKKNRPIEYLESVPPSPVPMSIEYFEEEKLAMASVLNGLRRLGYTNVTIGDLPRLRTGARDPFHEELKVMADVRAYFFVAYKRIIDNIPLVIEHALHQSLAENMKRTLLQRLNLGAPDAAKRLRNLMEEDPTVAQEREALTSKIATLEKIEAELRNL
ncbi:uncharacterized protein FOMMEDRAFT_170072 [Fomitiporia mediterranea MF3/22]|uniref:uncharacterized protein n=1 Tax=Fomitiporia mediterranea (strain MF3/22) TaxID=694068 RepID=UPI0004407925|nr:uncharacterized protein FOMMEDRAFT_170072 [Fomitiporia mediterranea MF3/22]EJC99984.1 hypothetical protein FOMMEDRAFT_170072 [Fomitiporia mediterranea MF3/22]